MPRCHSRDERTWRAPAPTWRVVLLLVSVVSLASPSSHAALFEDSAALLDAYHREHVQLANARLRAHGFARIVESHLQNLVEEDYGGERPTIYDKRGIMVELSVVLDGYTNVLVTMKGSATRPHVNARHAEASPEQMVAHLNEAFLRLNPGLLDLKSSVQHLNVSQGLKAPHLSAPSLVRELQAAEGIMREAAKRCDIWLSNHSKVISVQGTEFFVRRTHQYFRVSELRTPGGPRRAGNVVLGFGNVDYKLGLLRTTYRRGVLNHSATRRAGSSHGGFSEPKRPPTND